MVRWQNDLSNEDVSGEERRKRGFTAALCEKSRAERGPAVGDAILGGKLAADGAIAGRVGSRAAN